MSGTFLKFRFIYKDHFDHWFLVVSFVYIRDKIYCDFDQNVPDKTLFLEFVPVNMVHSSRNLMDIYKQI